jgi:hypothetical protein
VTLVKSNVRRSASTRHVAGSNSRSVNRFGVLWPSGRVTAKAAGAFALAAFFVFGRHAGAIAAPRREPIDFVGFGTILRSALQ